MDYLPLWVLLCVGCAVWAHRLQRNALGYFVLAFFLSPVVCAVLLLAFGPGVPRDPATGAPLKLRPCPFCREAVRRDAIKCKHCHSVLEPQVD